MNQAHGDLATRELAFFGFFATCKCGWRSECHPHAPGVNGRAEAYAQGLMHHRWWNQHPDMPFVGATREQVER